MSINLPAEMESSWKHYLFSLKFQSVHASDIARHTQKIQQICQAPSNELISELNTPVFWDKLKSATLFNYDVICLEESWKQISPLVHLNSKQLLILLEEEIEPLENAYLLLEAELMSFTDNSEGLGSGWLLRLRQSKKEINAKITENRAVLSTLKKMIYDSLLFRCSVYEMLQKPRNVDDALSAFCSKINGFNATSTLLMPQELGATLDDDKRLAIYDILSQANYDKALLHQKVLACVPRRNHSALSSRQEVVKRLSEVKKFCHGIMRDLDLNGHGAHFFSLSQQLTTLFSGNHSFWGKDLFKKIGQNLERWGLFSVAHTLWNFRYLLYLFASLAIYHQLIFLLQPFIIATLGISLFNTVSTAMFYTLGVAPLWYLGWTVLEDLGIEGINLLTRWKKQTILHALRFMEEVEFFLCAKLHRTIIDLPHFDIQYITQKIHNFHDQFKMIEESLNTFHFLEKWATKGVLNLKIGAVKNKLLSQQQTIQEQLRKIAEHIAKRVDEEIDLLRESISEDKLEPILPVGQLQNLKEFVDTYGDSKAQKEFDKNTNISEKWLNQLKKSQFSLVAKEDNDRFKQPWGGHQIRQDILRGWHILLEASLLNPAKKAACLQLNLMLAGVEEMSRVKFEELLSTLELENSAEVMLSIGAFLFQTLLQRPSQHAALLPQEYKNIIIEWHQKYDADIKKAKIEIDSILLTAKTRPEVLTQELEALDDETLGKYYELLDGDAIYVHATGQELDAESKNNKIRTYFEAYSGEHSRAFRLLKLIPEKERLKFTTELACKRITYLLANFSNGTISKQAFDPVDVEMFHSFALQKKNGFSFADIIRKNEHFLGEWNPHFEEFLVACARKGLPSSCKLLDAYQARTGRQKAFKMEGLGLQNCAQESIAVSDTSESVDNPRSIRVH